MTKSLFALLLLPTISFACPNLEGHYPNCHSEIKKMKGEYQIEQNIENGVEIYSIRYIDENGDTQDDEFKTDGSKSVRKKTIPTIGIRVKVEATAVCDGDNVISKGRAYLLGKHVGTFDSTIFKTEDNVLTMKISAQYLGKNMEKLIQCTE